MWKEGERRRGEKHTAVSCLIRGVKTDAAAVRHGVHEGMPVWTEVLGRAVDVAGVDVAGGAFVEGGEKVGFAVGAVVVAADPGGDVLESVLVCGSEGGTSTIV